ncbi:hypothetical protein C7M84_000337 [Penaeus vannamei]|uniref:Uncharacterized protein n=1 Tax=Penaeus vannamei TaxID=6689 RepID=A0A3R7PS79_PENVA|nr:hypothetical protein C7M84_000337 [Penaeus vannamei]
MRGCGGGECGQTLHSELRPREREQLIVSRTLALVSRSSLIGPQPHSPLPLLLLIHFISIVLSATLSLLAISISASRLPHSSLSPTPLLPSPSPPLPPPLPPALLSTCYPNTTEIVAPQQATGALSSSCNHLSRLSLPPSPPSIPLSLLILPLSLLTTPPSQPQWRRPLSLPSPPSSLSTEAPEDHNMEGNKTDDNARSSINPSLPVIPFPFQSIPQFRQPQHSLHSSSIPRQSHHSQYSHHPQSTPIIAFPFPVLPPSRQFQSIPTIPVRGSSGTAAAADFHKSIPSSPSIQSIHHSVPPKSFTIPPSHFQSFTSPHSVTQPSASIPIISHHPSFRPHPHHPPSVHTHHPHHSQSFPHFLQFPTIPVIRHHSRQLQPFHPFLQFRTPSRHPHHSITPRIPTIPVTPIISHISHPSRHSTIPPCPIPSHSQPFQSGGHQEQLAASGPSQCNHSNHNPVNSNHSHAFRVNVPVIPTNPPRLIPHLPAIIPQNPLHSRHSNASPPLSQSYPTIAPPFPVTPTIPPFRESFHHTATHPVNAHASAAFQPFPVQFHHSFIPVNRQSFAHHPRAIPVNSQSFPPFPVRGHQEQLQQPDLPRQDACCS